MPLIDEGTDDSTAVDYDTRGAETTLRTVALQSAIFNSANFSSIATDAKGVIQIFNVGAERMLGYSASDVVNRVTQADISDPLEVIARAKSLSIELGTPIMPGFEALVFKASRGIEDIYELTYIRKDGSRFPAVVSVTALRDAYDAIIGYLLIGTDNTARKLAEEALLKAGALQRAIFSSANFSCIATDANGVIQIFNVGAERMLGYAASEVVNRITPASLHDAGELSARAATLSSEFGTPILAGFDTLSFKASRGLEDIYELAKIRKDGTRVPAIVSVTALRDAHDSIIGYLFIGTDNTARQAIEEERKRLDQKLRDQHFYTRSLIESNIDALITTDPTGIITDVNRQMESLTGCTRDELIGAPFSHHFTDSRRADEGINRVLNERKVSNYELTAKTRDGALTEVSVNATTFYDRDRRLQGVFVAARDVTELKRLELTQQQNIELEHANRTKSAFLATMSHELRTPLNAIVGFSEVLIDGMVGELTVQQRSFVSDIYSSGQHLLSLINDILDLSKVEAGKMALELERVDLHSLFADGMSMIAEDAASRDIHVEVNAINAHAHVNADQRKLKQIVFNLLSNAMKFTGNGGNVGVHAANVSRADVGRLSGEWPGRSFPLADSEFAEFLKISVTDNGIGIAADGMERLFQPFIQVDSGLSRRFQGTGLGLAMVKLLAELHGGGVAVESSSGEGSCFTVWVPLRPSIGEARIDTVSTVPADLASRPKKLLALVLEDDVKAAELIRIQLEAEGFEVVCAASAEEALAVAASRSWSLITLDILLPHMDGWEFLSRVKAEPALRRVPVVIISIEADRNRGFALGASAVLEKPISRQVLYETLMDLKLYRPSETQSLSVLIADDDRSAVELIALRLLGLATSIHRVYGGRAAIESAVRNLPDLIVLDLLMPDINGFDVAMELHSHLETAHIPILVLTAKEITLDDRKRLQGCVASILEKSSFDNAGFLAEVRRAMSGRQPVA